MAAYVDCQNALIAILQTMTTEFPTTAQVVASDETILDKGVLSVAVLMPGPVGLERGKINYIRTWGIILDLYYAWRGDLLSSLVPFETLRAAVIYKIDNNPNLVVSPATSGVAGVLDTQIVSDGDPGQYKEKAISYIAQRFRITVYQHLRAGQ